MAMMLTEMLAGTLACAQAQDTRAPLEPAPYASSPATALMAVGAPDAGSRRPPLPREIECAASLGLPSGPIADCRDAILATTVTVTAVTGFVAWWYRGLDTRLDTACEGWFGADAYSGGIDKLGHMFSFDVGSRMMNRGFDWAGLPANESLALSTTLALGLGLGIEVLDGLARGG